MKVRSTEIPNFPLMTGELTGLLLLIKLFYSFIYIYIV
uniref:Uncharacterized protein n=1 Tax=Heterorhabditis bacteriophora TaxID=37862 RepID=A0A1I7W830_HETBA